MRERAQSWVGVELRTLLALALIGLAPVVGCGDDDDDGGDGATPRAGRGGDMDGGNEEAGRGGGGRDAPAPDAGDETQADAGPGDVDAGDDDAGSMSADGDAYRDLVIDMTGMTTAADNLMTFSVLSTDGELISRALLDPFPVGEEDYTFRMPDSVPAGEHQLAFESDIDGTRGWTPADESWVEEITGTTDPVEVEFAYRAEDTRVEGDAPGFDLRFSSINLADEDEDKLAEVRLIEESTGHVVGLYRGQASGSEFALTFAGVVRDNVEYRIDFWVDSNTDGNYDSDDHAWRRSYEGTGADADYNFVADDEYTDVEF
jgi:hypothetical protein